MKCRKLKIFEHFRKKQSFFPKKAQVEILGLMIIMVLIALGVLFAVKYVFLAPESEVKKEFTQKNIAEKMLDVLLDTDVKDKYDNYISIKNLLIDCEKWQYCDVENEIKKIFDKTLDKWGNKYYFEAGTIKLSSNTDILNNNGCLKGKKTGIQFLSNLEIRLEICD